MSRQCFGAALLAACVALAQAGASDWPRFRGPDLNASSPDVICKTWPTNGPAILWQMLAPGGYSACAVTGDRVFTLRNGPNEQCVALDAARGTQVWATALGPALSYSTPTVQDGRVYVCSGVHKLVCLEAATGNAVWERNLTNEFGGTTIQYGNSQSPWVEDGRVFVSIQTVTNCLLAFNATNGALLWRGHTNAVTYGSPVGATICGTRQIIFPDPHGLVSVAPADGRLLWRLARGYSAGRHGPSPVVSGDVVVCVKSDSSGSEVFQVFQTNGVFSTKTLWTNAAMWGTYVTLVTHEGHLYTVFNNRLHCYELATGGLKWRTNVLASPSVILADRHLLLLGQDGALVLAKASPVAYEEVARARLSGSDYQNSPAFSDGLLYVRCPDQLLCLDTSVATRLQVHAATLPTGTHLLLTIASADGQTVPAHRVPRIGLRWSQDLRRPLSEWESLPHSWLVFTNGSVCCTLPFGLGGLSRYYAAVEAIP